MIRHVCDDDGSAIETEALRLAFSLGRRPLDPLLVIGHGGGLGLADDRREPIETPTPPGSSARPSRSSTSRRSPARSWPCWSAPAGPHHFSAVFRVGEEDRDGRTVTGSRSTSPTAAGRPSRPREHLRRPTDRRDLDRRRPTLPGSPGGPVAGDATSPSTYPGADRCRRLARHRGRLRDGPARPDPRPADRRADPPLVLRLDLRPVRADPTRCRSVTVRAPAGCDGTGSSRRVAGRPARWRSHHPSLDLVRPRRRNKPKPTVVPNGGSADEPMHSVV